MTNCKDPEKPDDGKDAKAGKAGKDAKTGKTAKTAKDLKKSLPGMPKMKMPDIKIPGIKLPQIKMPEFKMPEIKMPKLQMPDVRNIDWKKMIPSVQDLKKMDAQKMLHAIKNIDIDKLTKHYLGKRSRGGGVLFEGDRPMKYPYTFTAKVMQFPWVYYAQKQWIFRYYLIACVCCLPIFKYISSLANSPGNVEKWKEIRRQERLKEQLH